MYCSSYICVTIEILYKGGHIDKMPVKLSTALSNVDKMVLNKTNPCLIKEFYEFIRRNETSERYQNINLKPITSYAKFLGNTVTFYQVTDKEKQLEISSLKESNVLW